MIDEPGTPGRRRSRATIVDVAADAGVHVSTASRALNPDARHRISDEVVRRIERAAERLGYRRNPHASSLRTRKSGTIGMVVPSLSDPLFPPIIAAIEERIAAEGYVTFVAGSDYRSDKLAALLERMIRQRVDGLIVLSFEIGDPSVELCLDAGIPTVAVLRDPLHPLVPSVSMDDVSGVRSLVEHVVRLGHRDVTYITPPLGASTAVNRLAGFRSAATLDGAPPCRFTVVEAESYTIPEGQRVMRRMLDEGFTSTAVVAFNDLLAVGCIDALRAAGLRCPDDVSVAGINDLPLMDIIMPPLTSLGGPGRDLGHEGADLLMSLMRRPGQPVKRVLLSPKVVVRASTRAPGVPAG